MCVIFKKSKFVCYERASVQKKKNLLKEKDNNWQLFVTRENNILNLLER